MGTRFSIAYKHRDDVYYAISGHWDGYPSWTGCILEQHYETMDKATALIQRGGYINTLFDTIDRTPIFEREPPDFYDDIESLYKACHNRWSEWVYLAHPNNEGGIWRVMPIDGDSPPSKWLTIEQAFDIERESLIDTYKDKLKYPKIISRETLNKELKSLLELNLMNGRSPVV